MAKVARNLGQCCLPKIREGSIVRNHQDDHYCCFLLIGKPMITKDDMIRLIRQNLQMTNKWETTFSKVCGQLMVNLSFKPDLATHCLTFSY